MKDYYEITELTNMCMVYDGTKVLVQDRVSKSWCGLAFPGGHVDKGESFSDAVIREIYEETGLTINIVIAKLRSNIPLTSADIKSLESILWNEVGTKQDYEEEYGQKPLGELVREIVGMDMNAAKEAFSKFLSSNSLDAKQIYFVNQIIEYIVHNGNAERYVRVAGSTVY